MKTPCTLSIHHVLSWVCASDKDNQGNITMGVLAQIPQNKSNAFGLLTKGMGYNMVQGKTVNRIISGIGLF